VKTGIQIFFAGSPLPRGQRLDPGFRRGDDPTDFLRDQKHSFPIIIEPPKNFQDSRKATGLSALSPKKIFKISPGPAERLPVILGIFFFPNSGLPAPEIWNRKEIEPKKIHGWHRALPFRPEMIDRRNSMATPIFHFRGRSKGSSPLPFYLADYVWRPPPGGLKSKERMENLFFFIFNREQQIRKNKEERRS
jgi:hypothetical protein